MGCEQVGVHDTRSHRGCAWDPAVEVCGYYSFVVKVEDLPVQQLAAVRPAAALEILNWCSNWRSLMVHSGMLNYADGYHLVDLIPNLPTKPWWKSVSRRFESDGP